MPKDVVGKTPPVTHGHVAPRKGCSSPSTSTAAVDLPFIATLYGKPEERDHRRAGRPDLPRPGIAEPGRPPTPISPATSGRSSPPPRRAGPAYARNAEALRAVQPEDVLPGDIDANLGAPWIPGERHPGVRRRPLPRRPVVDPGRPPEEGRRLEHRRRLRRRAVGRRHLRVRHGPGQRHLAPRAGPEHEDARHLRHDPRRRPRGAGRQPGGDARRPREAEADQGAVPLLGLRRPRPHRAAGAALQRHLQQPAPPPLRRLAPRLPRHEPDHHAAARTRRTPSGAA